MNARRYFRPVLAGLTAILLTRALYAVFLEAPREKTMGEVQRIFYFHVPSAWVALLAFFICFLASIIYLATRAPRWDWAAVSAAEIGVVFTSVVLVTGPIWARPVWGIWWTWDARLTSTLVMFLIYIGYLLLRDYTADPRRRANLAAVFGIIAFVDAPIVYMSIRWWRTQHPQPVIAGGAGSGLDPAMWRVFLMALAAMLALFALLFATRFNLERQRAELESLRQRARRLGSEE